MTNKELTPTDMDTPFLLYGGDDEKVHVRVFVQGETLWLPQRAMGELFDTSADNISLHLKNIYADGELTETATAEEFSVVQNEGKRAVRRAMKFYNLDAIKSFNKTQKIESDFDKSMKQSLDALKKLGRKGNE